MYTFDLRRIFLGDLPLLFLAEIVLRTAILYIYALFIFRTLGKRSVGELTPLELIVVVGLGSAVGDPMFYPGVPVLHGILVITVVAVLQRIVIYFTRKHERAEQVVKGHPVRVVIDGNLDVDGMEKAQLSREEVFMTLRQNGYNQLGQVRRMYIETDGKISDYQFDAQDERPGLPLLPPWDVDRPTHYATADPAPEGGHYGCVNCGNVVWLGENEAFPVCPRCNHKKWIHAVEVKSQSGSAN